MRVVNIIFIVVFVLSAVLQYNDLDPYVWIPLYLYGAWLCFRALRNRYEPVLYAIGLVAYTLYALYLLVAEDGVLNWWREHDAENIVQSMKAEKPWIEQTREFGGLLLLIAALVMNGLWLRARKVRAMQGDA